MWRQEGKGAGATSALGKGSGLTLTETRTEDKLAEDLGADGQSARPDLHVVLRDPDVDRCRDHHAAAHPPGDLLRHVVAVEVVVGHVEVLLVLLGGADRDDGRLRQDERGRQMAAKTAEVDLGWLSSAGCEDV